MAHSLNRVCIIGNLGKDPEVRATNSGTRVCNLTIATEESWKDSGGETKRKTDWHRVTIWGGLVEVAEKYLRKGSLVYIAGKLQTRQWEKDGQKQFSVEIHVQGYEGKLLLLDGKPDDAPPRPAVPPKPKPSRDEMDDEIPF